MRYIKSLNIIFGFLFIISFESINSEETLHTQNSLRLKNPFQISTFATTRSSREFGFIDLHLGYNIRENLTIGISIYTLYPNVISIQGMNQSILELYEKKNTQPILYTFAHYFPFGGGFYIAAVIGRYPGIIEKHTELSSATPNSLSFSELNLFAYSRPLLSYTITYDPRYNAGLGFGYKWIFQNGLFLGGDYGLTAPTPIQKNIYLNTDIRDLNRHISYDQDFLLKKQLEWENHKNSYDKGLKLTYFVNIHFGISF